MRLDRLITLYWVQPIRRVFCRTARAATNRLAESRCVSVLMYHGITDEAETGVSAYHQTNTSPSVFRQHMQYLRENDYETMTVSEALRHLDISESSGPTQRPESKKSVVITFDDGFRNFYTHAFPILQEFGLSATMFLPTVFINREASSRTTGNSAPEKRAHTFDGKTFLTWPEVRELRRAGIEMGSHTVNHPRLVDLSWPEIELEIRNSKLEIETELGEPITTFAYPFAFPQSNEPFVRTFKSNLKRAGYDCCVTTEVGRARPGNDPYRLKRLPVNSCDDVRLFRSKLEGDYDWLGRPQSAVKTLKHWCLPKAKRRDIGARPAGVVSS